MADIKAMATAVRNLILTGGIFHPFETAAPALAAILEEQGITSDITEDMEAGLCDLTTGRYDMLTIYALRWRMLGGGKYDEYREKWAYSPSPQARQAIVDHIADGGGLFGLHTAAICFDDWPEWGKILGATWVWGESGHPPHGPARTRIDKPLDPLVAGLDDFILIDEVYGDLTMEPDVEPIISATAATNDGTAPHWQPVLWRRQWEGGRVGVDLLGHDAEALGHPVHRQIIARTARWVADGRDDTAC